MYNMTQRTITPIGKSVWMQRKMLYLKLLTKTTLGYWVDNDLTLEDYRSFNPVSVSAKEFEALWGKPFIV